MDLLFDTTTVLPKERFDFWHENVCKAYSRADARVENDFADSGNCRLNIVGLGSVLVGHLQAPQHHWIRTRSHISQDDNEIYMISFAKNGRAELDQFGRRALHEQGEIVIYDSSAPFAYDLDASIYILKVPKRLLEARLPRARELMAVRFGADQPLCAMLGSMMVHASELDEEVRSDQAIGGRLANSMIDVLASMCDILRDTDPHVIDTARLEKVMRFVRANLGDADLTPEDIASVAAMSVRSLNRAFGALGTTPMKWVWNERLASSRNALSSGHVRSVTEAAFAHGYKDVAHFSRSFKKLYGITPRRVQAQFTR
ncbi:helix-turn-helix domain-containing protein [Pseudotabrizicola sp. 4114]|uniref:helix-turn-helix domain-containing protein n=1 Tax=Pseudotabrizicola sp. 4114 TaxID=2817731 RepID=UPI002861BF7B|nr:AraC-like DNA-binding protein [Pseudorhodobacter sp. 4114]